jgi:HK97 gp10 family phage protein
VKFTVRIDGLKELDHALGELPKATARNTLRRVLMRIAQPMASEMKSIAPDDPRTAKDLKASIGAGTKLSPRQAKMHRKATRDDKNFAEVFVGAGPIPHSHLQEFGTTNHGPQPYVRPVWDAWRNRIVPMIKPALWEEIEKAAQRLARKAAKQAAKG